MARGNGHTDKQPQPITVGSLFPPTIPNEIVVLGLEEMNANMEALTRALEANTAVRLAEATPNKLVEVGAKKKVPASPKKKRPARSDQAHTPKPKQEPRIKMQRKHFHITTKMAAVRRYADRGVPAKELAAFYGCSPVTIHKWFNNLATPAQKRRVEARRK